MTDHFDVIVAGVGSMGASSCYELAKSGLSVLGLESRTIINDDASHSGQTRILRKAYFEHPDYVPLLKSAYHGWDALEQETGKQFYHPVGLAYLGKKDHPLLQSVKASSAQYDLSLKQLNQKNVRALLPDFAIPPQYESIMEPEAGLVCTDQVIAAYCDLARNHGVTLKEHESVQSWEMKKNQVIVSTSKTAYTCDKLILTSGSGMAQLLPKGMPPLKVTRQLITWVKPKNIANLTLGKLPCWVLARDDEKGIFYGFPMLPASYGGHAGLKVAHHYPGEVIDELTDEALVIEKQKIEAMMQEYMPEVFDGFLDVSSCLYTYSPDDHFVIDFIPDTDQRVVAAAGFSGHGFKFVPVMGEVLRDLAVAGKTEHPVSFLKADRDL
ncbi:MAG: N-methyl-L-tryptophan oxidase [Cytophagales bacterium]|nr:N-methyl-L-tryptophan oxidase [Cytophagales bacterium]